MFDVFYSGSKPNLFAHEREAQSIEHAQQLCRTRYFWWTSYLSDYDMFDFDYEPAPWQSEFTHAWPSQHHNYSGTYLVPAAGEIKYHFHKDIVPNKSLPAEFNLLTTADFDYTWHPHPMDQPFIYVFGNQWHSAEIMPTVEYAVTGATERKYMTEPQAQLPERHCNRWRTLIDCEWDYSWVPDPGDPPFIYVFGNQHWSAEKMPTLEYHVPGATEVKYMSYPHAQLLPDQTQWTVPPDIDGTKVDYSWVPDPGSPPLVYQFGTQHQRTGGPIYTVPGATEVKYINLPRATKTSVDSFWSVPDNIDTDAFDWTWHPDATEKTYIYQFGTQHQSTGGPVYTAPGATEIKYVHRPGAVKTSVDSFWSVPDNIDTDAFDWTWHPNADEKAYIYQFGTQHQRTGGPVYAVPGATEIKYVHRPCAVKTSVDSFWSVPEGIATDAFDWTWHPNATDGAYSYQFGTQWQRTGGPVYIVPGATEVKYVSYPRANKTSTDPCWTVPAGVDTDTFDWTWHPDAAEKAYIYQFGTQHQRTGGPVYSILGATEVKYVDQIRITNNNASVAIYEIDHLDGHARQIPNVVKTIRYFDNYRDTLIRLAKSIGPEHEWVWVCSSICDYTGFDFSWHPEQWQTTMLHVFPSNDQKFGDTFYMHVPTFAERAEKKALLEWYDVNFVDQVVPRRPLPVIEHSGDSNVDAVKTAEWAGPLALFTTNGLPMTVTAVNLWRSETKTITPLSAGASAVIVPRVAVPYIKTQLYDYPYIDKKQQRRHGDTNLDIVFISNGEANADINCAALVDSRYNRNNLMHRVDNVKGRVAAYHAAARASTTPWFFAVFAKLRVEPNFNWDWQPDRMQQPKHYIFHAENTVNGLVYGHQAMIAYNRDLVLSNPGLGLDFTLDSAHEVVPVLSGRAYYQETPWMCWRTAFREVLKLRASLPNVENEYRLKQWLVHEDAFEYSHLGAEDAVEYYESVKGDPTELRKSYEWDWLASYAFMKRNLLPDQQ